MKVFLIRHGEANASIENIPLTEKGFSQAKLVSRELQNYNFDKIYSSNLLRAKQTCMEFTKEYVEDKRLKEVYRVLIGGPIKEGTRLNREEDDRKNADEIFDELINSEGENVLVFAHGNIIRYFIKKVQGLADENLWTNMKIDNCSITIIENNEGELRVNEINRNNYLIKEDSVEYIEE